MWSVCLTVQRTYLAFLQLGSAELEAGPPDVEAWTHWLSMQILDEPTPGYWFKISMAFVLDHIKKRTSIADILGDRSSLTHVERSNKVRVAAAHEFDAAQAGQRRG